MPTQGSATGMLFGRAGGRELVAAFDGGRVTSEAGALLLGATDRAIRLVDRFAACFRNGRHPAFVTHRVRSLVGQRIFGLALGYEDLVDHDDLRHDPVLGALLGRFERDDAASAPLAGKSTLNRLEHAPADATTRYHKIGHDAAAIEAVFVDLFLGAFRAKPPRDIILDLDATDDPIHGHQEGRFFHGSYDCYCYLPLYIFCGRHLLAAKLRRSNIDASAGCNRNIEMTPLRKVQMAPSCYSGLQENGADDGGVDERQGVFATIRPARFGGGSYHDPGCGMVDGFTPPAGVPAGQVVPSAWRGAPGLMPPWSPEHLPS